MNATRTHVRDLTAKAADTTGQSIETCRAVIKAYNAAIIETIKGGNDVVIPGLVCFKHAVWKGRPQYNLKEGVVKDLPDKNIVSAKVSRELQEGCHE